jgi:FAD/FMN-containing dehydrogenase/Fe-S oxidoreductase
VDPERQRVQDDLRGLIAGEVRCDDVFLQLYASDASLYEVKPLGVARPRTTADVAAIVEYASRNRLPLHARGAGTGLAGESLGPGLIVDFSRFMRRITGLGPDWVRLQPGVVHAQLNRELRGLGRIFGPDPATSKVTTMGGVISVDSGGSHWLRYGSARRHVLSLQVVLADGMTLELGQEPIVQPAPEDSAGRRRAELVERVAALITKYDDLIRAGQSQSLVNRSGYQLGDLLVDGRLDLARLISGSEGTLALITEATVATQPLPKHRGVALLMFDSVDLAARAVPEIVALDPSACDLMDRRHLSLARGADARYDQLVSPEAEAVLLVERDGDEPHAIRDWLAELSDVARRKLRALDARSTLDPYESELFWGLARGIVPTLHRAKGTSRPLPFVEDLAVPPHALPEFLTRIQNVLKRHQVIASLFGHVGHGQIHLRPFLDLTQPGDVRKMEAIAEELYREVVEAGGTVSGEHADGLSRTPYLRQQYGPLYDVFRELKAIFDPLHLLNPGKVVADEPVGITQNLRSLLTPAQRAGQATSETEEASTIDAAAPSLPVPLQLRWEGLEYLDTSRNCNGCGACREVSLAVRMCPIFHLAPAEEASPRAKANLTRGLLTGRLEPAEATSDELKEVADLCVNCHMCRLECPSTVDIPKLMLEAKASYVATNGLRVRDWILARLDVVGRWGCRFPRIANALLTYRGSRFGLDRALGLAQGRKLARFNHGSYLRTAAKQRLTRPARRSGRKVLLFLDTYANYFDSKLADALVAVLEHNGVAVYVHPDQQSAGMGMVSAGALEMLRPIAQRNVRILAEAVRQGYHIVTPEPSAALCLTHEYLHFLPDDEARLVADNTSEACTYLWRMHQTGTLQLDFRPQRATVGYHLPCHLRALQVGSPGENLLRLVPGLQVIRLEHGCCGMAGSYGMKRENYRASLRIGWGLISALRQPSIQAGATECSTCKMQMEQGTSKPTIHPLKLLALAYGKMPEFAALLTARGEELVVT